MGQFTDKPAADIPFQAIIHQILPHASLSDFHVVQFCDDGEGEINRYNVFRVSFEGSNYVLKKSDRTEESVYRTFLAPQSFPAPHYYGCTEFSGDLWILIEYISGTDLRSFTEDMAYACAESVSQIMNAYWQSSIDDGRFSRYWQRIQKRALCLEQEPLLRSAYQIFLQRQLTCPRTLCNGDLLQYNAIYQDGKVSIIDWAFAGIMPYSLDIARLIAHGRDAAIGFPFSMTDEQRDIFVRQVYKQLTTKPDWDQYLFDIQLSLLNEYIEFLEWYFQKPNEERDEFFQLYYTLAANIATEIIEKERNI